MYTACLFVETRSQPHVIKAGHSNPTEAYRCSLKKAQDAATLEISWRPGGLFCLVFVSHLSGVLRLRSVRHQESGDNSIEFQKHAGRLLSLLFSYHAELRTAECQLPLSARSQSVSIFTPTIGLTDNGSCRTRGVDANRIRHTCSRFLENTSCY